MAPSTEQSNFYYGDEYYDGDKRYLFFWHGINTTEPQDTTKYFFWIDGKIIECTLAEEWECIHEEGMYSERPSTLKSRIMELLNRGSFEITKLKARQILNINVDCYKSQSTNKDEPYTFEVCLDDENKLLYYKSIINNVTTTIEAKEIGVPTEKDFEVPSEVKEIVYTD